MPPIRPETPAGILAELINRALERKGWSADTAEKHAKARSPSLKGLGARNIRAYSSGERTKDPSQRTIRNFAKLFGETEQSWLAHFPTSGLEPLLLKREAVMTDQGRLQEGDEVFVVSSGRFLEATEIDVTNAVMRNLDRGVAYTYYFPIGHANPHGTEAAESYERFLQDHVAHYRFSRPPLVFGYGVDPGRFAFFSRLSTIARHWSRAPGQTRTYVYIEPARGESGQVEQAWYLAPDAVWKDISLNLRESRKSAADDGAAILPLNPCLPEVRGAYVKWFQDEKRVTQYGGLRPVLGHAGTRCINALVAEIGRTVWPRSGVKYLDIGCGDGEITKAVVDKLTDVCTSVSTVAIDVSASQLSYARARFEDSSGASLTANIQLVEFEGFHSKESFDLITAVHSLYTIDEAYIRRLYALLAPGGIACIWMARRANNVVTAVSDELDKVLRQGQRRNTADDIQRYAELAGLSPRFTPNVGSIPRLVDGDGNPTADGQRLIDFCALQPVKKGTDAWRAAVAKLGASGVDGGQHPLNDALIVITRAYHRPGDLAQ